jgi:hypothetical protein
MAEKSRDPFITSSGVHTGGRLLEQISAAQRACIALMHVVNNGRVYAGHHGNAYSCTYNTYISTRTALLIRGPGEVTGKQDAVEIAMRCQSDADQQGPR